MMVEMGAVIFLAVFSSIILTVSGQAWTIPYFLDPSTDRLVFDQFVNNAQRIRMDEELPRPIKLAIINYYGLGTPYIGDFIEFTGGAASIVLNVTKTDDQWAILIENRQDYENPNQRSYEFEVGIRDDSASTSIVRIQLLVENKFDNDPNIIYDGPCVAEELQSNFDTNCRFQVYDVDGLLKNDFRIEIEGNNSEANHFEFRPTRDLDGYTREYSLFVTNELRYVDRVLYNFKTIVYDIANNNGSVTTIVEIVDVPSEDPIWVTPFATLRLDEKTTETKQVKAIDGDTGINLPIHYKLDFHSGDYSQYITVDATSGLVNISEINRDELKQEVFLFHVIAYKAGFENWTITGVAVVIVDDINDNLPDIEILPNEIEIDENKYLTLDLEKFIVNDIDLGIHATYSVSLLSGSGLLNYAEPFSVIPTRGYQESIFTISVIDTTKLDFEDLDWQSFVIIIKSQEVEEEAHNVEFQLTVKLKNWNDEFPIFNQTEYTIDVWETIKADQILTSITATDRDIGDKVLHRIVGVSDLSITDDGTISTSVDDTFDYERQTRVLVQIQATDTLESYPGEKSNSAFAQLIINVIDVNDETPQIRMPRQSPFIEENSAGGTLVTNIDDGIIATDPDTTADLEFSINWELSYATKSGQAAQQSHYENCFIIEANKTDDGVVGHLIVNPDFPIDIDYEKYEVLYLAIFVTDLNQEVNEGTADAVLTVRIEDVNDNRPLFILDTLNTPRSVVEEASAGTIGTIFAQDIDGPQFNVIKYSIKPSSESTPDDLIEINEDNGVITVKEGAIIDCDGDPKIYDLVYTVTLNDSDWTTEGEIRISIIDINNKNPLFGEFENIVELYENATTGDIIQMILVSDMDRDMPHNISHYMINYAEFPNLARYFEIDELSGQLSVKLQGDAVLDRDHEEKTHNIYINIEDNYLGNGRTNTNKTMVLLILLDVNDNAPTMPDLQPTISENAQIGDKIVSAFYAPDIDDPSTPNAAVEYRIVSVVAGGDNAEQTPDASDIFEIQNYESKYCDIVVKQLLKGFYGTWLVTIEAYDHGHEWTTQLQLKSEKTYEFGINPYNYMEPILVNPWNDKVHRLSYDNQQIDRPLILDDDTAVPMFEARDDDGGEFGDISFEITNYGGGDDASYFRIQKESRNRSQIFLTKQIEARNYQLNVRASDGGSLNSDWAYRVRFNFVDLTGEPYFDLRVHNTNFTENVTGLSETRIIPEAIDPKNDGIENEDDKFRIYYFIDTEYLPNNAILFELDSVNRILRLTTELDREEIDNHQIRIIATNTRVGPQNPKDNSMLIVNISVNDVNDNPPSFERRMYGAGITPTDWFSKEILIVTAYDPDLDDEIEYMIHTDGIKAVGDYLDNVERTAFTMERTTGVLKLNFDVLPVMKGYFEFKIVAVDKAFHEDVCDVKIFIIADSARVTFVLLNEKASVELHRAYVAQTLSEFYEYECYIDDITPHIINEQPQDTITNVRVHFINNSEAIEADVILSRSGDIVFITNLKTALLQESINLLDVPNNSTTETVENMERIVRIILIVVAVILAALCCSLIVAYCIKTRSLNRQLKALSATDFGSTESNLNRREAPTTNVFSVEGSNPVLNNNDLDKGIFDNMSVMSESSDDSDFVGLDNDPTFAPNNGKRESTNVAVVNGINGKLGNINLQDDFDNYMNESKKSSRNSDFGFSKF